MNKVHESREDITAEELKEIKQLYAEAEQNLNGLNDVDSIDSRCNHINGYTLIIDDFDEANYLDIFTIQIATDNTEPNSLQGVRVYLDKETSKLSRFIDIFFNDEEYPFEDYDIKSQG